MKTIKSCVFNMDTACVDIIYESGSTLSIYTPMIEQSLRTTVLSRSKLDWLIDHEPHEYARMVLDGTMQDYLDTVDDMAQNQMRSYTKQLEKQFPPNIAEDIAREIMMYS